MIKKIYNGIWIVAMTCITLWITSIAYGLSIQKITTKNWWKIVTWKYYVRWYYWGQYAFDLQKKMFKLGFSENDTIIIINNCKKQGKLGHIKNVGQCIKTAWMIWYTESSGWQHCLNNNCMGLYSWRKAYKNKDKMFKDWISKYIRYWFNHPYPYEYYGRNPKTRYCFGVCMNGLKNSWIAYKVLNLNK